MDAVADGDGVPAFCIGPHQCVGDVVRACVGGKLGGAIETCPAGTCSLGRCATAACAAAESDRTGFAGCLFYAFEADNVTGDADLPMSVLVTNPSSTGPAAVTLQRPMPVAGGTTSWDSDPELVVAPHGAARFLIAQDEVRGGGPAPHAAIRFTSDVPVTVALIQSDDQFQGETTSSAGTMVLPAQFIGGHYRVMTYPQTATPAVAATPGGLDGAGRIAIVGTQPGTHVTVTLSPSAAALATSPAPPFDAILLGDGDVLQIYSSGDGSDLSGTDIMADLPVAVFSGNMTTSYGRSATGVNSPDMVHEQMPPVGTWSRRWVAAALPPQAGICDTLLGTAGASIWRVLASEDDTSVTFDAPNGVVGLPTTPTTLAAGQVMEWVVSGGSFKVTATRAVLVTQGIDCEPSLSLAVSLDRLLDDLWFAVLPYFDQVISVVRPTGTPVMPVMPVMLDDQAVADASFLPAGAGFEVAQVPVRSCPASNEVCPHHLTGHFGMTLRGMDVLSSYALTAPTFAGCVDLSDPTCVP
jgi:hypothetical protein